MNLEQTGRAERGRSPAAEDIARVIASALVAVVIVMLMLSASTQIAAYDESLRRVVDETGTLTSEQIASLDASSASFRETYGMDCVMVLVGSLGGKSARDYADDYYDYGGYGMGADNSGVLCLVSIGDRELYVSTCGRAIEMISDREIDMICDDVAYYLADDDWYRGFSQFAASTGRMIERSNYGDPEPVNEFSGIGVKSFVIMILVIPTIIAAIAVGVLAYRMNNARGKSFAADYTVPGTFRLTGAMDILLSRHVSRVAKSSDSGSHGGSSHTSSSGVSHGGGGRHF